MDHFNQFFFFQAEDGIRDPLVTGVQTCALPIFVRKRGCATAVANRLSSVPTCDTGSSGSSDTDCLFRRIGVSARGSRHQIGRASCRERVWIWVVGVSVRKREKVRDERVKRMQMM